MKLLSKEPEYIFTIDFDLDTILLSELLGENSYRNSYTIIKKYFKQHGIVRDQYSGYHTLKPMTKNKMELILQQFAKQNPEIGMSFNKLRCNIMLADMELAKDISTIGQIDYQEKINENDKKEEINKKSSNSQKIVNSMEKDILDDF